MSYSTLTKLDCTTVLIIVFLYVYGIISTENMLLSGCVSEIVKLIPSRAIDPFVMMYLVCSWLFLKVSFQLPFRSSFLTHWIPIPFYNHPKMVV